jgi:RNA recognition motif-containing protein
MNGDMQAALEEAIAVNDSWEVWEWYLREGGQPERLIQLDSTLLHGSLSKDCLPSKVQHLLFHFSKEQAALLAKLDAELVTKNSFESFYELITSGIIESLGVEEDLVKRLKLSYLRKALDKFVPSIEAVWLEYLDLIGHYGNDLIIGYIKNALKACRTSLKLRCLLLLYSEASGSWSNVQSAFDNVQSAFNECLRIYKPVSLDEFARLYLCFCACARRILWAVRPDEYRSILQMAVDAVNRVGRDRRIERFWMRLEYHEKNFIKARSIRDTLLGNDLRGWVEAIWLEITAGELNEAKTLLQTAIKHVSAEERPRLFSEYERFCLEHGHLKDHLEYLAITREYPMETINTVTTIRKREAISEPTVPPMKKLKPAEQVEYDPDRTVFLSNLAFRTTTSELESFLFEHGIKDVESINILCDKNGKSRGLAHVVFHSPDSTGAALCLDRTPIHSRPLFVSPYQAVPKAERQKVSYQTSRDEKILFLSHLPSITTKEDLESLFIGGAVRLVITKSGHFKGAAYVEYPTEEGAAEGLKLNGIVLHGTNIRVETSDPELAKSKAASLKMIPRHVRPRARLDL